MAKTAAIIAVAVLGIGLVFLMFGKTDAPEMAPIVDPTCEPGTERVGEGCMPLKDACEIQGDNYYFDESQQKCLQH